MSLQEIVPIVEEGIFEESIQKEGDDNNAYQHGNRMKPQKTLPPGKEYHIFICYESSDREYAHRLKNILQGCGFKCCCHDDDFIAGKSSNKNMEIAIQTSHKLLFVISKHFVNSSFCELEVDCAITFAARNNRNDFIISVRLEECDIGLTLGSKTYIDGINLTVEDVGRKVETAFYSPLVLEPQRENGRVILQKNLHEISKNLCCSLSCEFQDLSESDRRKLEFQSIEKSSECYQKMAEYANDLFLLKQHTLFINSQKSKLILLLFFCCIVALASAVYLYSRRSISLETSLPYIYAFLFLTSIVICLLFPGMWLFSRLNLCKLHNFARKNTDCKSQTYLVLPNLYCFHLYIVIIYYNMKPCWDFIEQTLQKKWPDASEEKIDKICRDMLFRVILNSSFHKTSKADVIRHKTYKDKPCLCQLAMKTWTTQSSGLTANKGQGTESGESCVIPMTENGDGDEAENVSGIDNVNFESAEDNVETMVMKIIGE